MQVLEGLKLELELGQVVFWRCVREEQDMRVLDVRKDRSGNLGFGDQEKGTEASVLT